MSSYEHRNVLAELEKELDSEKDAAVKKKDGFVRVVGFSASPTAPSPIPRKLSVSSEDNRLASRSPVLPPTKPALSSTSPISIRAPESAAATSVSSSASSGGSSVTFLATSPVARSSSSASTLSSSGKSPKSAASLAAHKPQSDKQGPPEGAPVKKKLSEMTKAERRELQEKQRAVKAAAKAQPAPAAAPKKEAAGPTKAANPPMQYDVASKRAKATKRKILSLVPAQKQVPLFSHLPQYERGSSQSLNIGFSIHPSIVALGLKLTGGNARCVGMLAAFKDVIRDYTTPPGKTMDRDLDITLKPYIQFLIDCRPLAVSMANAINYVKMEISKTSSMTEEEAKACLHTRIDEFIEQRIIGADILICQSGVKKISNGDVVLTYACSSVVEMLLKRAYDEGKRFRVVVVDSRPKNEGRELLRRLLKHNIECTYILLNAVSYIMKDVDKVFVGASTLMNNGNLLSRVGTAAVAMMANLYHVPVLVCCETYKFCERVSLDSIVLNELGNPEELVRTAGNATSPLADWKSLDKLRLLNLAYDVTPTNFITMVVTEVGNIPPTSVPVVIREYRKEPAM